MRSIGITALVALIVTFTVSPTTAEDCDIVDVQNLNSRAEAEILLLETSESADEGMLEKLAAIKSDFREANEKFSAATDKDDRNEILKLCPIYQEINGQLEALKN